MDEVEEPFGHGGGTSHCQVVVHHDNGNVDAVQEIGQVVVDLRQFDIPITQLVIQGGQLLVGGLELFLGGFQFLVGALELLIAGLDLLVCGFEFLVGGFLRLDYGLERFLVGIQFAAQPDQLRTVIAGSGFGTFPRPGAGLFPFRLGDALRFLEENQQPGLAGGRHGKGNDMEVHFL